VLLGGVIHIALKVHADRVVQIAVCVFILFASCKVVRIRAIRNALSFDVEDAAQTCFARLTETQICVVDVSVRIAHPDVFLENVRDVAQEHNERIVVCILKCAKTVERE
jgi:hypothetical protein